MTASWSRNRTGSGVLQSDQDLSNGLAALLKLVRIGRCIEGICFPDLRNVCSRCHTGRNLLGRLAHRSFRHGINVDETE